MKCILTFIILSFIIACSSNESNSIRVKVDISVANVSTPLQQKQWYYGSDNCQKDNKPAMEVFRYQSSSYIIRQNKCQHFEAPFMYLLFGKNKALLMDTGATKSEVEFPLYQQVNRLMQQYALEMNIDNFELLVLHSHNHSDHYASDNQFFNKANVSVISPTSEALTKFLNANRASNNLGEVSIELGNRKLTIIPTPGHQEEAITLYDSQTQWLLTGDSFYPGLIYVKHWEDFRASIKVLNGFSQKNKVSAILGSHIEMKSTIGQYYDIGSTYQPNEASLMLTAELLNTLSKELDKHPEPRKLIFNNFIVIPMNGLQKTLSDFSRLILN